MGENKCIIFGRVSSDQQDLTSQEKDLLAEAVRQGYSHANIIYIMHKESAVKLSILEREGLNQLMSAVRNDKLIDCCIIHEISRLTRRPKDLYEIRDFLIERKIQLICLKPYFQLLDKSTGKLSESANLLIGLYSSMIENEGYIRKERLKRGKDQARKNGRFLGGYVRFGYALDPDGHLVPDAEKADIVRTMFRMYADGYNVSYIREYLHKLNINKRNETILNMLNCDKYIDLIGQELWVKVCEVRKSKTSCGKTRSWSFAEQLIKCPKCGRTMMVWSKNYKCYGRRYNYDDEKGCDCTATITRKRMDALLFNASLTVHNMQIINGNEERKESIKNEMDEFPKKLENAERRVKAVEHKMEKVSDSYISGLINKEKMLAQRDKLVDEKVKAEMDVKKIHAEYKMLQMELDTLENDLLFKKCISQEEWLNLGKEKIYEYVHKYIEKVELDDLGDNKKIVKIYPFKWTGKKEFKYKLSGRGRTFRVIEEIEGGVELDYSRDKWYLIDFSQK